ncbi:hypothetical protein D3C71_1504390 [compost metagenome]
MRDFIRDIKPPTVYTDFLNPITTNVQQIISDFRILSVEFWHDRLECKCVIGGNSVDDLWWPLTHMKPIGITGRAPVGEQINKWRKGMAAMIKDTV